VLLIGLTGSIGMGKSTAAQMLRRLGVPVFDADATVHRLQGPGGAALPAIAVAFPGSVKDGILNRAALGAQVFASPAARTQLEGIVHPLVRARQRHFLCTHALRRTPVVVLDIPLLLEGKSARGVDLIAVVSAPGHIQRRRVLARPGMTPAKFAGIMATQMADKDKRRRADLVIPSGRGKNATLLALKALLRVADRTPPRRWPAGRAANRKRSHA
jgi:dephospho-CoA kinase